MVVENHFKQERAERFAGRIPKLSPTYRGSVDILEEADATVAEADIVFCSTRSETPVFSGEALRPGTHINGVGSYLPHMQEVDETTLQRCNKIVVDTIHGQKKKLGILSFPKRTGCGIFPCFTESWRTCIGPNFCKGDK